MSERAPVAADSRRRLWQAAPYLHLLGLGALAFAQPLFDLLGRNPELFVVQGAQPTDLLLLALGLSLLVPLPLLTLRFLAGLLGRRPAALAQGALVALLVTVVVAQLARQAEASGAVWLLAPVAGAAVAGLYSWVPAVRLFASFLAPAALVLPALFLLQPSIRGLLMERGEATPLQASGASAPVVFLLLDELGLPSLLDASGRIDGRRFPHLAELAAGATWFRDATTVADNTLQAVPALLTGRHPRRGTVPHLGDHPENLFTLLGGDYAVYAEETHSRLCPPGINRLERPVPPRRERLASLSLDLAVVWLHLSAPPRWREGLPPISHAWGGFVAPGEKARKGAEGDGPAGDLRAEITRLATTAFRARHELLPGLLEAMGPEDRSLYFIHLLLPHVPWEYLPSGARYHRLRDPLVAQEQAWPEDETQVAQAYARHLLQTMYVDRLVGDLVARLREVELYDRALVVVTADHGATFRAGSTRRHFEAEVAAEVLAVPLLIKAPGQTRGRVVDLPVSLVDVLPTLLDILGVPIPDGLDGVSAWRSREPLPRFVFSRGQWSNPIPALLEQAVQEAGRLQALVFDGVEPEDILRVGPYPDLVGRSVFDLGAVSAAQGELRVDGPERFAGVDLAAPALPLLVSGTLQRPPTAGCCALAVAVGGVVRATTTTLSRPGERQRWAVLLPEDSLVSGHNSLEVLLVENGQQGPHLARFSQPLRRDYHLALDSRGRVRAVVVDGVEHLVGTELRGWLGAAEIHSQEARISGWAVDLVAREPAEEVAFFSQGRFVGAAAPALPHTAAASLLGDSRFLESRFESRVPAQRLPDLESSGLRAFALASRGIAGELGYYYRHLEEIPGGGEALRAGNGRLLAVVPDGLRHWVDEVRREGEGLLVVGWAADAEAGEPAAQIVATLKGRYYSQVGTGRSRPGVSALLGVEGVTRSGFRFPIPAALEEALVRGELRLFAISGSRPVASELRLPPVAPAADEADAQE